MKTSAVAAGTADQSMGNVWNSTTLRRWRLSLLWTIAIIVIGVVGQFVGRQAFGYGEDAGMFHDPFEVVTRIVGFPHYLIAFLFAFTAYSRRAPIRKLRFLCYLAGGAILLLLYQMYADHSNPIYLTIFGVWFIVHALVDEGHFYASRKGLSDEARQQSRRVTHTPLVIVTTTVVAFIAPVVLEPDFAHWEALADNPWAQVYFSDQFTTSGRIAVLVLVAAILNGFLVARLVRHQRGGIAALWQEHKPIVLLFALHWVALIFALVISFYIFILIHFVTWYVFAVDQIRSVPRAAGAKKPTVLARVKTTLRGFHTLHLGLIAIFFVVVGVQMSGAGAHSWLIEFFGAKAFIFWTVLHMASSLDPK